VQITRVSHEFPFTSAHAGPNSSRLYPDIGPGPRTDSVASAARALPAGGGTAACVGAFVGVAAADDEEDTGGDAGAAVEDVKETVAVGDSCGGEEAEPHPATPTARPANRQANRAARIWRIHVPLCPEPTAAQEARAISEESTVQWTSIAGSQFPS